MSDDDFVFDVSAEEIIQAEILPTGKYLFEVGEHERVVDAESEEDISIIPVTCLNSRFKGWVKNLRFKDDGLTKMNVRFLKGCGVEFEGGKSKRVKPSALEGIKLFIKVKKSSSEEYGVFNRLEEFIPYSIAGDEDDED